MHRAAVAAVILMALVSLAVAPAAIACVNTFASEIHLHLLNQDRAGAEELVAELEAKYRQEPILENYNDAAVGRLLIGDLSRAIELLKETESKFPGKAIVAANLGTAYELSGKPEEALRWISEGVKRDPKELVHYLFRESSYPNGCLLMTGTGIVPTSSFTLDVGDVISISIDGIGTLVNSVEMRTPTPSS